MFKKYILLIISLIFISSCSSNKNSDEEVVKAEILYQRGLELIDKKDYNNAAKEFGKIYFQHPGGSITPYAELMEAYSLFMSKNYSDASDVVDNFIKIHPAHSDIDYAYYLKAMSNYMEMSFPNLDQSSSLKAKEVFISLQNRFPHSRYSEDIKKRIDVIQDNLAANEMEIAVFYQMRNNLNSAIPRFQNVLNNFENSRYAPEALYRLYISYKMLGLDYESLKVADKLKRLYPDNNWTKKL